MLNKLELKLLAGYDIDIGIGKIYQVKVKDVIDIGENLYNYYLGILLYDTSLIPLTKDDLKKMELDEFTTFDFLIRQCLLDKESKDIIIKSLEFFLHEKINYSSCGFFYIGNFNDKKFITRDNYKIIKSVLIKSNYLKELEEEEKLVFANERAKQMYLDIKKKEKEQAKFKSKSKTNLHSIISALIWKSNKKIEDILKMTIYQLYDGYYRLFLIDDCSNITQGIYHGTINGDKINPEKLNWARIIKFEN